MAKLQKLAKALVKAGYTRDRAVYLVTIRYRLSMRQMELLHYSVKG